MNNLANKPEYAFVQKQLDKKLKRLLQSLDDKFLPGMEYVKKWGYVVDEKETIPYIKINYRGVPIIE
jgi:hypothetical protein